jgi:diguanylate cyclase (GGDEF)-like protein/PAS domain S-box-containing protein
MNTSESSVFRSRLRRLGKPGLAEAFCAGLALLCLLAPTWWMLQNGRAERLAELDSLMRGSARSSAEAVVSQARLAAAELQAISLETRASEAAQSVLDGNSTDHVELAAAANRSLQRLASVAAEDFLLVDAAGGILAESSPGGDRIVTVPPPRISPWAELTGRGNRANTWQIAVSLPIETKSGNRGWLLYSIDLLPLIDQELRSTSSGLLTAYAVSTGEPDWILGEKGRDALVCGATPGQLLARSGAGNADASAGANMAGYQGCRGAAFGGWAREPAVGLSFVVETNADAALRMLKATRLTTVGLSALLGASILILILMQTTDAGVSRARRGAPRKNTAAWGILALSLLATTIAGLASKLRSEAYEEERIASVAQRLARDLEDRVGHYAQVLAASASAYRVLPAEGEGWREFTKMLQLQEGFPGVRCIALIPASPDAAQGEAEPVRAAGGFSPAPDGCPSIQPDETTGAKLTMLTRRSAASAALAAGVVRWTASGEPRESLALVRPVSRLAGEEDEVAGSGWIVALTDPSVLFEGVIDKADAKAQFALYEGASVSAGNFLVRSGHAAADSQLRPTLETAKFGGTEWTVAVLPEPFAVPPFAENYPFQIVLAGLAISVLLFDIALVLSSTRARAVGIAALMTERFRESEARIRAVIDHASDGIIAFDAQGRISTYNPGAEKRFGYSEEEAFALHLDDLLPGWEASKAEELSSSSADVATECVGRTKDGTSFPAELTISRIQQSSGPDIYSAIIRDITARKLTEEKLRESEERYALASRGANDGLWDWNLKTNEVYFSSRWKEIMGHEGDEVGSSPEEWFGRVHPDDLDALRKTLDDHLQGHTSFFESEHRVQHAAGGYRWVLSRGVAVRDGHRASRLAGSQTDVTNRKNAEKQLRYDALHDQLTGLSNRTCFMAQLENARASASKRAPALFGLLFLDLDRFKVVNDSLGHMIGDQLLVAIAGRLKACVRPGDSICRLGGDEFAVLVEKIDDVDAATQLAERIQEKLQEPLRIHGHEVFAAVSIGIALSSDGRRSAEEMLRDADIAMYRAKAQGRGRYEVFDRRMHAHAVEVLQIETDLRRAVERGEFVLHYQPILDLAERRVLSCEALLRWQHPQRGLLYPGQFLSIAEETGIIQEISSWLLKEACRQNRAWRDAGLPDVCVSVNVSPRQFVHQDVAAVVELCLAEHGLEPSSLQLELTEGALMESSESSLRPLTQLYQKGVQISLDDFGTGYSSLVYLRRFPIHNIKVDQSFVKRVPADSGDVAVVAGLIGLAHTLGLRVIAEGVETAAQLQFLRDHNCDAVQGYLLGRPRNAATFAKVLAEANHPVAASLRDLQATMTFD